MARAKNNNLKKPNQEVSYTHEQIQELKRCAQDPVYFINNYVMIQHPVKGAIPFELYDYQIKMVEAFKEHRFTCTLSSRQTGKCFFYSTMINTIKKPIGLKKVLLFIINKDLYNEIFKEV